MSKIDQRDKSGNAVMVQGWEYLCNVIGKSSASGNSFLDERRGRMDNVIGIGYNWWVRFRLYGSVTEDEVDWVIELMEGSADQPDCPTSSLAVVTVYHTVANVGGGTREREDRTRVTWYSAGSLDGYIEMTRQATGLEFMSGIVARLESGCPFNKLSSQIKGLCTPGFGEGRG